MIEVVTATSMYAWSFDVVVALLVATSAMSRPIFIATAIGSGLLFDFFVAHDYLAMTIAMTALCLMVWSIGKNVPSDHWIGFGVSTLSIVLIRLFGLSIAMRISIGLWPASPVFIGIVVKEIFSVGVILIAWFVIRFIGRAWRSQFLVR